MRGPVTPDLYAKLRASGEWEEEERYGKIFLKRDAVEINPRLDRESYSTTAEEAVPFMNLNELLTFKRALGRAKDLPDIVISRSTLRDEAVTPNAHAHRCRWRGG
jgi:hypothetical protein